mgnify:CR=1 FL=1
MAIRHYHDNGLFRLVGFGQRDDAADGIEQWGHAAWIGFVIGDIGPFFGGHILAQHVELEGFLIIKHGECHGGLDVLALDLAFIGPGGRG